MRRGQLFSMDALISIVLVIMILGTVSATSESLRSEITSLVGWYERANIADNMLDVLTKSPGEPEDWEENPQNVRVVGLLDRQEGYLNYEKIKVLFDLVQSGNSNVISSLCNLSHDNNFKLTALFTNSTVFANISVYHVGRGGGVSLEGFSIYDCSNYSEIGGNTIDGSVLINCTNTVRFSGPNDNFQVSGNFCTFGDLKLTGAVSAMIGSYVAQDTYLAINGTFKDSSSNTLSIYSRVYVTGAWWLTASASRSIYNDVYIGEYWKVSGSGPYTVYGDVYVFGNRLASANRLIWLVGSTQVTINGNLYVRVNGVWYAVVGNPSNENNWYRWDGTSWTSASDDVAITGDTAKIDGIKVIEGTDNIVVNGSSSSLKSPPGEFPLPPCLQSTPGQPGQIIINVMNLSVVLTYPTSYYSSDNVSSISILNCTPIDNSLTVSASMNSSPWIEFSERRMPVLRLVYSKDYFISSNELPKEIYSGLLDQYTNDVLNITLPTNVDKGNLTLISAFSGKDYTGYSVLVIVKNDEHWVYGINMTRIYQGHTTSGVPEGCYIKLEKGQALVPFSCLVPPAELDKSVTFTVWAYSLEGFPEVTIEDIGNLDAYLKPVRQMGVIRLWVWPRR
ncbi:hypothetical protein [Thermococcus aciditolerans]|uniref:Uncharacterized protein n=1 Tax=Thermococcus aciditolerans TaxID=2598455 RepID=A0A5C0SKE9_9EURY|nr:hypothetical protein [Thermococcus aciditolerans]QEK14893.1 hypothetical protein FPV09_07075 [Thermococcus aciditolerans]